MIDPSEVRYRRNLWRLFEGMRGFDLGGIAEVGVAEGNFAEEMLNWPVIFPVVYLVDRWRCVPTVKGDSAQPQMWHEKNLWLVKRRMKRFGPRVQIIRDDSNIAAGSLPNHCLHLVNIDADHSYQGVISDILAWWPKLKKGGVMSFHDYQNPSYGVKAAVSEFAVTKDLRVYHLPEDKPEDAGAFLIC